MVIFNSYVSLPEGMFDDMFKIKHPSRYPHGPLGGLAQPVAFQAADLKAFSFGATAPSGAGRFFHHVFWVDEL
jgi:hypothetical protein